MNVEPRGLPLVLPGEVVHPPNDVEAPRDTPAPAADYALQSPRARVLPVAAAAVLLLVSGVGYGLRTDRWGVSAARTAAVAKVSAVPAAAAGWTSDEVPMDAQQLKLADADVSMSRVYRRGEHEVSVILLAGRAAPLAVHTPDVCFPNAGRHLLAEPERWRSGPAGEFWSARFVKAGEPGAIRAYWAWSDGGPWKAAGDARIEFARRPALYKLYVVCRRNRDAAPGEADAAQRFITEFVPELNRTLAHP